MKDKNVESWRRRGSGEEWPGDEKESGRPRGCVVLKRVNFNVIIRSKLKVYTQAQQMNKHTGIEEISGNIKGTRHGLGDCLRNFTTRDNYMYYNCLITRIVLLSVKFVLAQYEEISSQSVRWSIHIKSEPFTNTPFHSKCKWERSGGGRGMERKEEGWW